MFKKWWVFLIQGILMFILGIFIFRNPEEVLAGISFWSGILITLTGISGLFGWIFGNKETRENSSLIWSIVSLLFGVFVLFNILATMKAVTVIFGFWILITGLSLISTGWSVKNSSFTGWVLFIIGLLSLAAGLMMIFNIGSGAEGVAAILGIQVILSGIALIMLSFVKKAITAKAEDKIREIKSRI